ncbi:MAG: hypothetical protein RMM17_12040 [Acidobacteriota bacterium]|nr:hypothetical protein [Blastocatellia bacterium]MDW8413404.1 hypothetical protein [Acidobacteriota bacterium]
MFRVGHPVRVVDIRPKACCNGKIGIVLKVEQGEFGVCYVVRTDHVCKTRYYEREIALRYNFEDICTVVPAEVIEDSVSGEERVVVLTEKVVQEIDSEHRDPEVEKALALEETEQDILQSQAKSLRCALCSKWFELREGCISYGEKMVPPEPVLYACAACVSRYGEPNVLLQLQDRWLACTSATASSIPVIDIPEEL